MAPSTKPPASSKTKAPANGASPKRAQALRAFAPLSSSYPEGSWEREDDLETQALSHALRSLKSE